MTNSFRKIRESGNELVELKRVRLKPSTIPFIFPNLPKYFSKQIFPKSVAFLLGLILAPLQQDVNKKTFCCQNKKSSLGKKMQIKIENL